MLGARGAAAAMVCIMALLASAAWAQTREAVRFARGANAVVISGTIQGSQYREHSLRARAGQQLELAVVTPGSDAVLLRVFPAGRGQVEDLPNRSAANEPWRVSFPAEGEYIVRVALPAPGRPLNYRIRLAVSDAPPPVIFVVEFLCADRSTVQLVMPEDRASARIERLGQSWLLPRAESPTGTRFADAAASFTSRGEEGILERRGAPSLRCRQVGR